MDRKCDKKIKSYCVIWLVFVLLFSCFMYAVGRYEAALDRRQMLTLMAEYPEMQPGIISIWKKSEGSKNIDSGVLQEAADLMEDRYGYKPGGLLAGKMMWGFWGLGIMMGTSVLLLFAVKSSRKQKRERDSGESVLAVYECLERFRRGDFSEVEYTTGSENWMKLWESIRELGIYFSDLRERLAVEEDSTKALITDISHQLKTPLASLRMSHELMAGDQLTEEEKREFLMQEEREINQLEALMKELINLSRLETRMIQIRPVPAGLRQTVTEAVSRIYLKAKQKEIDIQMEMEEDLTICHDVKWTEEAIANVLDNAVKYSEGQTTVTLRIKPLTSYVLIEIEDEGMGIAPGEIAKIYQRFYRGNEARASVRDGAGVGLYLSRMILERQGGTISAKSKKGEGTTFKITLPCR